MPVPYNIVTDGQEFFRDGIRKWEAVKNLYTRGKEVFWRSVSSRRV